MTLPSSPLYESADLMRENLQTDLFPAQAALVTIGRPSKAEDVLTDAMPVLNLFFYKIQPPGFFPDTLPNETWRVRLHCLVTAFAASDAAGDDELKMIAQVLSYFHEHPTLKGTGDKSDTFLLEVVFQPLSSEEINQIWSTFGDISYRTSLTYEVALVPVEPRVKAVPAPPVASGGPSFGVARMDEPRYERPPSSPVEATIGRIEVDLLRPDWAPAIAFVEGGKATPSLTKSFTDFAAGGTFAELWIAGEAGEEVTLTLQSGVSGIWSDLPDALNFDAPITVPSNPDFQLDLDPSVGVTTLVTVQVAATNFDTTKMKIEALPPGAPDGATQFLLYARRTLGNGSAVRSNPLILNFTGSKHAAGSGS